LDDGCNIVTYNFYTYNHAVFTVWHFVHISSGTAQ